MEKGKLLGIGNPLLDLTVHANKELLIKYKLEANNAVIAEDFQKPIYKDLLENYDVQFTAGGSVQNSLRVCQWILREPKICVFFGSVGRDKYSRILEKTAEAEGVDVRYQYQERFPTGTCAVVITSDSSNKRSLCANLGAAEKFTIDHIQKPENMKCIDKAQIFYISGFFLTVSPDTAFRMGEIALNTDKVFFTNLSASFISKDYKSSMLKLLPYIDFIIGNDEEALSFAEGSFETKKLSEIALKIAKLPKLNHTRKRVVIITQGPNPVIYVKDNSVFEMNVPVVEKEKIVDTNGAGDAFVGGFLSQYITGKPLEKCIECGIWAATHIIQHSGVTFERDVSYVG